MDKENLHGYEPPDIIMICPEEGYAYDLNGNPYHKLRSGCGWIGPRKECAEELYGPTLLAKYQWIEYLCPNCSDKYPYYHMKVENRDRLMALLEDPSLIPVNFSFFGQHLSFGNSTPPLSSYPGGFELGRQYFLDKFKNGDKDYYKGDNEI